MESDAALEADLIESLTSLFLDFISSHFFKKRLKCKVSAGPYIRHYQGTRLPSSQTGDLGCHSYSPTFSCKSQSLASS